MGLKQISRRSFSSTSNKPKEATYLANVPSQQRNLSAGCGLLADRRDLFHAMHRFVF
jgi:hypothetical protein